MKSRIEIEQRLHNENDMFVIDVLRWVLDGGCPFCDHKDRADYERQLVAEEVTPDYLEAKHGWPEGTVMNHMEAHLEYNPRDAAEVEEARERSIDTLTSAEGIVRRIEGYLNELEERKENDGMITPDFVSDATRLIGQANSSIKLIAQLKKEIGVDSQFLLAQTHMNNMNHVLVDVLKDNPQLLDEVEFRMQALRAPRVEDVDFEVVDDA
tara:strand:+ start:317 stop:946 length:630 start_codon:yes stop_codon:yes gene_type:complete